MVGNSVAMIGPVYAVLFVFDVAPPPDGFDRTSRIWLPIAGALFGLGWVVYMTRMIRSHGFDYFVGEKSLQTQRPRSQ